MTLKQLESELGKFASRKRKLRKPEYYLFATNVVLTPKHKSGKKDRTEALFKKYAKQLSLKGYDPFDVKSYALTV